MQFEFDMMNEYDDIKKVKKYKNGKKFNKTGRKKMRLKQSDYRKMAGSSRRSKKYNKKNSW